LSRIEKHAFNRTGLIEIILPSSIEMIVPALVEVLSEECFFDCRSLSSVTFE
jgi:hypothetical protein